MPVKLKVFDQVEWRVYLLRFDSFAGVRIIAGM